MPNNPAVKNIRKPLKPAKKDTENEEYISKAGLKTRGWTDSMISIFLGNPDLERFNPHYKSAPKMKLYKLSRIINLEGTEEFNIRRIKSEQRSKVMKKVAKNKEMRLLEEIKRLEISVRIISPESLLKASIKGYNDFHEYVSMERGNYDFVPADSGSDKSFLQRIQVNYLRHNLTEYDHELENVAGKIGIAKAILMIKEKVYDAIALAYPYLSQECNRQKQRVYTLGQSEVLESIFPEVKPSGQITTSDS